MKVLLADKNHDVLHEILLKNNFQCDLFWDKSNEELISILDNYDVLVIRSKFKITKEILEKTNRLKCIARVGAGMENIDSDFAQQKGIVCLSVPEGNRDAVGEHAIGMLLMLLNNLKRADNEVRQGIWKRAENRGHEIKNKTVGIIGYGNTGTMFAKKLSGFDCRIIAYDKYKKNFGNSFVEEVSLENIFDEADILSIHIPYNSETHYLVNKEFISRFKKPFYFINTSRGKCANTENLLNAINDGKILGACLDVLEFESSSFENVNSLKENKIFERVVQNEKIILTPHIAGWTNESNFRMSKLIAEKIVDWA